jgi:hypothetical protein
VGGFIKNLNRNNENAVDHDGDEEGNEASSVIPRYPALALNAKEANSKKLSSWKELHWQWQIGRIREDLVA